jgi:hypothetical protein
MLSLFRTPNPATSVKIHRALTGSAVAIAAAVAGTLGAWSAGTAAAPTAIHRPVGPVGEVKPVSSEPAQSLFAARQPGGRPATDVDAFSAIALNSASILAVDAGAAARRKSKAAPTPRQIAIRMLHHFDWGRRQFRYLGPLWDRESSWNVFASNPYSGAYGIPQAVPGSKMASAGRNWLTSARTQIRWGLRYIKDQYGSPRAAWDHELATGWY